MGAALISATQKVPALIFFDFWCDLSAIGCYVKWQKSQASRKEIASQSRDFGGCSRNQRRQNILRPVQYTPLGHICQEPNTLHPSCTPVGPCFLQDTPSRPYLRGFREVAPPPSQPRPAGSPSQGRYSVACLICLTGPPSGNYLAWSSRQPFMVS